MSLTRPLLILLAATLSAAHASPPGVINHHGRIAAGGTNINATGFFKFALVDTTASETLWTNDNKNTGSPGGEPSGAIAVPIVNGHYAVPLGDPTFHLEMTTPIPADIFTTHDDLHLRIWFSQTGASKSFELLTPDRRLASTGYALTAATAEDLPDNTVTSDHIQNRTITSDDLGLQSVNNNHIAPNSVSTSLIADNSIRSQDILNRTILSEDLALQSITNNHIAPNSVSSSLVADNSLTAADLAPNSVDTSEIADGSITTTKLATSSVGSDQIINGTITSADIAFGSIGTNELATGAVQAPDIATGAVRSIEVLDNSLTAADLAANSVTAAEIATSAVASAEVLDNSLSDDDLAPDSVTSSEIAPGAVHSAEVFDNSLTSADLAANSVTASEIAPNAVGSSEIATGAVGSSEIATGAVGASEIATDAVGSGEIAIAAVTTEEIKDRTITGADITLGSLYLKTDTLCLDHDNRGLFTKICFASEQVSENHVILHETLTWDRNSDDFRFSNDVRATSFIPTSDRNAKTDFADIDPASVLEKVASLPITTWSYKEDDPHTRHIGPVAQDFHAAFALGADDVSINTIDADGVALAAIKALKAENETLKNQLKSVLDRLQKIESTLD